MFTRSGGWRTMGASAALLSIGVALLRLGRHEWLAVDWSDLQGWLITTETEAVMAALARLVGLGLVGWIGVSTVFYLAARLVGVEAGAVRWLSIAPFRRAVDALLAGYLLLGTVAPAGAVTSPGPEPPPSTREAVDPGYIPVPAGIDSRPAPPQPPGEGASEERRVEVVEAGDHLWKLAADRMAEALGRAPTEAEVAPYWVAVVEANRHRIRSGEPDVVFPGEEIVLPPLRRES